MHRFLIKWSFLRMMSTYKREKTLNGHVGNIACNIGALLFITKR